VPHPSVAVVVLGSGSEVARVGDPARDLSVSSSPPRGTAGRGAVGGWRPVRLPLLWLDWKPAGGSGAGASSRGSGYGCSPSQTRIGTTTCMPLSFSTLDRSTARTPTRRLDVRISGCFVSFFLRTGAKTSSAAIEGGGDAGAGRCTSAVGSA
jgi:hypothetical protein